MRVPIWRSFSLCLLLRSIVRPARQLPPTIRQLTPLVAEIVAPPHVVPGSDGKRHIVYELALTNITGGDVRFEKLAVVDPDSGAMLATLGPDELAERVTPGASRGHETRELAAYQFAVVFLHVALAEDAAVPARITHEITAHFAVIGGDMTMTIGETRGRLDARQSFSGRLCVGKGYVAADGCCDSIRHVRALLSLDGKFHLAQRFAIDWEQIDEKNTLVVGDTKVPGQLPHLRQADPCRCRWHGGRDAQRPAGPGARRAAGQPAARRGRRQFRRARHRLRLLRQLRAHAAGQREGEARRQGQARRPARRGRQHRQQPGAASAPARHGQRFPAGLGRSALRIRQLHHHRGRRGRHRGFRQGRGDRFGADADAARPADKLENVLPLDLSVVDWPQ